MDKPITARTPDGDPHAVAESEVSSEPAAALLCFIVIFFFLVPLVAAFINLR